MRRRVYWRGGEKMAKIGAFSGHGHRDLLRDLGEESKMPFTYQARVPIWNTKLDKTEETIVNFLLPFEILESFITPENLLDFTQFRAINWPWKKKC